MVMNLLLASLLILTTTYLWAQGNFQVVVTEPKRDEVFGWAQYSPFVTIKASLQQNGEPVTPSETIKRLFLTAQVFVGDRLTDTVPLWDDATHGDEKAQDGIFTANYRPNQTGSFKVRVRGQVDLVQDTKIVTKEFWSPFASFQVVAIPYPHVTSPEPGSKTAAEISVRASMLQQGSPFNEQDKTLKAHIVAKSKGQIIVEAPLRRKGSIVEGTLNLPKVGTYQLAVIVSVNRMGKELTAESQAIEIQVTRPNPSFLIIAILAFIVYLILPIKQPSLRYRHRVRIGQTIIELNPGEEKTVNEISVKGAIDSNTVTIRTKLG
ncbi:MAG: hypothetical protein NZ937_03410 [Armatimonadetes bacterium]|nr:hypothetical protein [Armatimonadota bacterium]